MPKVVIVNEKREIEVPEGANLRTALRENGVQVYKNLHRVANCFGNGLCGSCQVMVTKGMENLAPLGTSKEDWLKIKEQVQKGSPAAAPKTKTERFTMNVGLPLNPLGLLLYLGTVGNEDKVRLSCQVHVYGDCTIETTPGFNWHGDHFWKKEYPNK